MKTIAKSVFISAFPLFALAISVITIINIYQNGLQLSKIGIVFISLTIVLFFVGLFVFSPARTSKNLPLIGFPILLGFSLILYGSINSTFDINSLLCGFTLITAWFFYINWYSSFNNRTHLLLNVSNIFPSITLENYDKESISSDTFLGMPTIYVFYRGNWCPLCLGQIHKITEQYKELKQRGVNMVFISPQPHSYSKNLAKKYDLGFRFLTDSNNKVAKQLNILNKNGIPMGFQILGYDSDTVFPTVIITDKKGKIIFADLTDNYRVRPEPKTFLDVIDSLS